MESPPASWLTDHAHLLPRSGAALDLACGRGRHALWLAARMLSVTAIDRDPEALDHVRKSATSRGLSIATRQQDLETASASLEVEIYDVIAVVHYLHRPLFPALIAALKPGGLMVYETFTRAQATVGKPTNPDFLLEPGELIRLVEPIDLVAAREGFFDGKHLASVIAQKPGKARYSRT